MEFTGTDKRKLIYFLWCEGCGATEISKRINNVLGENSITSRTCQQWVTKFKDGIFDVEDQEKSGRPSLHIDEQIRDCIEENKYATTSSIALSLGVSKDAVRVHLLKIGKRYLCNRWLPHHLSDNNRANRVSTCQELLDMFRQRNFLRSIVTVDEVWIYWVNDRSYHNRSWFGAGDTPTTSVAANSMTKNKFMAVVFWDAKGLLQLDVLPQGQTLNTERYCALLDDLSVSIKDKRRCNATGLYFLQDNARSHTAQISINKLNELGFTNLPHPAYSPDLSPSD